MWDKICINMFCKSYFMRQAPNTDLWVRGPRRAGKRLGVLTGFSNLDEIEEEDESSPASGLKESTAVITEVASSDEEEKILSGLEESGQAQDGDALQKAARAQQAMRQQKKAEASLKLAIKIEKETRYGSEVARKAANSALDHWQAVAGDAQKNPFWGAATNFSHTSEVRTISRNKMHAPDRPSRSWSQPSRSCSQPSRSCSQPSRSSHQPSTGRLGKRSRTQSRTGRRRMEEGGLATGRSRRCQGPRVLGRKCLGEGLFARRVEKSEGRQRQEEKGLDRGPDHEPQARGQEGWRRAICFLQTASPKERTVGFVQFACLVESN